MSYGVYTRRTDLEGWKLEKIATLEQARIEEEFNTQFHVDRRAPKLFSRIC